MKNEYTKEELSSLVIRAIEYGYKHGNANIQLSFLTDAFLEANHLKEIK